MPPCRPRSCDRSLADSPAASGRAPDRITVLTSSCGERGAGRTRDFHLERTPKIRSSSSLAWLPLGGCIRCRCRCCRRDFPCRRRTPRKRLLRELLRCPSTPPSAHPSPMHPFPRFPVARSQRVRAQQPSLARLRATDGNDEDDGDSAAPPATPSRISLPDAFTKGDAAVEPVPAPSRKQTKVLSFGGAPKCPRCDKPVYHAERVVGLGGVDWHRGCLRCSSCDKTLGSVAEMADHKGDTFCKTCYGKLYGPKGLDLRAREARFFTRQSEPGRPRSTHVAMV